MIRRRPNQPPPTTRTALAAGHRGERAGARQATAPEAASFALSPAGGGLKTSQRHEDGSRATEVRGPLSSPPSRTPSQPSHTRSHASHTAHAARRRTPSHSPLDVKGGLEKAFRLFVSRRDATPASRPTARASDLEGIESGHRRGARARDAANERRATASPNTSRAARPFATRARRRRRPRRPGARTRGARQTIRETRRRSWQP